MSDTNQPFDLQKSLEAEFCPPLDTSLVAALMMELNIAKDGGDALPEAQVQQLRATLAVLAQQAEKDDALLSDAFTDRQLSSQSTSTDETGSQMGSWCDTTSCSSSSSPACQPFTSPLAFLQAAFPRLSAMKLRKALDRSQSDDVDMEKVVESLLNEEYIRELKERGLGDDELATDEDEWQVVIKKDTRKTKETKAKKKKPQLQRITVVDIRQKHHLQLSADIARSAPDPWTQIASLSTHLEGLLGRPSTFFASYFHSPKYATPAIALRNALAVICKPPGSPSEEEVTHLFGLLDILCSSSDYEMLDPDSRAQVTSDAQLALNATNGHSEQALDLVWMLKDLDRDVTSLQLEMGPYHSPIPMKSPTASVWQSPIPSPLPTPSVEHKNMFPPSPTIPISSVPPRPKPPLKRASRSSTGHWQTVESKPPNLQEMPPHAEFIPAYNPTNVPRIKIKGSGNAAGKGGKGDVGELDDSGFHKFDSPAGGGTEHRSRLGESRRKRDEALREAGRYWQRGNNKSRGGEIAFYFAERAREYQEQSKKLALDAAREVIENKRMSHGGQDIIDLHGITANEAVTIVKEVLDEGWVSPMRPLKIITGRGSHSVNRVGVLGPAVKKALDGDGWMVGKWDGGLIVRGKGTMPVRRGLF